MQQRSQTTLDCSKELPEEVIVSVMLPTRKPSGGGESSVSSVDEIYVVVVKPNVKYSTYACPLKRPVLVG